MNERLTILPGDFREVGKTIAPQSVQCVVTSPPYYGLRSYLKPGHPLKHLEIGQERRPDCLAWTRGEAPCAECYVCALRKVFAVLWLALRADGTVWLNLGDSYSAYNGNRGEGQAINKASHGALQKLPSGHGLISSDAKEKDLLLIPSRVALALQADGWYLRSDIIWHKPNVMPESVTDRCTRAHEFIFLLTKRARYFYDAEAIKEPASENDWEARKGRANLNNKLLPTAEINGIRPGKYHENGKDKQRGHSLRHDGFNDRWDAMEEAGQSIGMRNKRDVWTVSPANYPEAHFATFPPELIKPCILAGSKIGDLVLDPFGGSGTTGEVALELGRRAVLVELNPEYLPLIEQRTHVTPGLALA